MGSDVEAWEKIRWCFDTIIQFDYLRICCIVVVRWDRRQDQGGIIPLFSRRHFETTVLLK